MYGKKIMPSEKEDEENYEDNKTAIMAPLIVSAIVMGFLVLCLVVLILSFWWGHKKSRIAKTALQKAGKVDAETPFKDGENGPLRTTAPSRSMNDDAADARIEHVTIGKGQEVVLDVVGESNARAETRMMRVASLLRSR